MSKTTTTIAYKGFNKDMTCRDFQYEQGKEYIQDWRAVIVDGKDVKADTWYRLENGELIECNES